jgi:hypothetical protein
MFSVAKVVKTLVPEPGMAESLDDFRYKILNGIPLSLLPQNHSPQSLWLMESVRRERFGGEDGN